ncbi:MAG: hypothetical protein DMG57_34550 [Acidobacteria bacterium]|nr:MAG: hypothetical protein DMG57_34550 [Acidobacteriota bacterium]
MVPKHPWSALYWFRRASDPRNGRLPDDCPNVASSTTVARTMEKFATENGSRSAANLTRTRLAQSGPLDQEPAMLQSKETNIRWREAAR